jgi:glycosyltransferase involved in cell wall biosynthesis
LIASAWSDNPKKGGPFYKWLETNLDWDRFEFTFVGRTKEQFTRARHIPPQPSEALGRILREHDIFIAASHHEACSNALIEAMACGLPAIYMNDAGNGELVQFGGLPFSGTEDALDQINRVADSYASFQSLIHVDTIDEIACRYIETAKTLMEKK